MLGIYLLLLFLHLCIHFISKIYFRQNMSILKFTPEISRPKKFRKIFESKLNPHFFQ